VQHRGRTCHVHDFPISVDVEAMRRTCTHPEVIRFVRDLHTRMGDQKLVVQIERIDPSKNILRGLLAFGEMLRLHPELRGRVRFLAVLLATRSGLSEYQRYADRCLAAVGRINTEHGAMSWEPVRAFVEHSRERALAALQMYDVLLANPLSDGMTVIAKQGPIVNQRDGVVVLSERAGGRRELEEGALMVPPLDVQATAEAIHHGLMMPPDERAQRARRLRTTVERHDLRAWIHAHDEVLARCGL
jgi:trehalose 6-phosphate synthase